MQGVLVEQQRGLLRSLADLRGNFQNSHGVTFELAARWP
jgi:hypothetical protein